MEDICTASDGGNEFFDESPAFDGEQTRRSRNSEPTPNNLSLYRWRHSIPDANEDRELIRLAQAGKDRAKDQLAKNHHRTILKMAARFYGPSRDDLIAAGMAGLAEAIARFDLRRNNGFNAFARALILNALRTEARIWRRRGQAGATRADRWVYDHPESTVAEIVKRVGCTVQAAEAARSRLDAYWAGHKRYDTTERGADDDNDTNARVSLGTHQSHHGRRIASFFSRIDALAEEADRRAARRLKQIGRRAYALELVERDRALIQARARPENYLYSWHNAWRQQFERRQKMKAIPAALKEREIVSVKHAALTAGVDQRTFLKRMVESKIPLIELGPRKRALKLADFDKLISTLTATAA